MGEGEARTYVCRLDFDRRVKVEFHGTKVASDAGLLAYRELDEALLSVDAVALESDTQMPDVSIIGVRQAGRVTDFLTLPLEPIINRTWRWNDIEKVK